MIVRKTTGKIQCTFLPELMAISLLQYWLQDKSMKQTFTRTYDHIEGKTTNAYSKDKSIRYVLITNLYLWW